MALQATAAAHLYFPFGKVKEMKYLFEFSHNPISLTQICAINIQALLPKWGERLNISNKLNHTKLFLYQADCVILIFNQKCRNSAMQIKKVIFLTPNSRQEGIRGAGDLGLSFPQDKQKNGRITIKC